MMAITGRRRAALRLAAGLLVSVVFGVATIRGVDLPGVATALARVAPAGVAVAIGLVFVELALRALRWRRLLAPIVVVPLRRSVAYLSIGYFANSMLPARLGDLARAYLAGRAFGAGRLAVLGTIVVERLADGVFILAVVALLGVSLAAGASLAATAAWLALLGVVGATGLVGVILFIRRPGGGALRARLRSLLERVLAGTAALRTVSGSATIAALTVAAFMSAVLLFSSIAGAAGVELSLAECALAMGAVALSTSIPAAPGSLGTYEFVGVTILAALGLERETALAIVVLVHVVVTIPVALVGFVTAWRLHFRVSEITADADPSLVVAEEA